MNSYYIPATDGLSQLFCVWSQLTQDKTNTFLNTPFGIAGDTCIRNELRDEMVPTLVLVGVLSLSMIRIISTDWPTGSVELSHSLQST